MDDPDLVALVTGGSEDLDVEYKGWMNTSEPVAKAKLARHLAALANHGGGSLIFGVGEESRKPQGATTLPRTSFDEDGISSIVTRYLEPTFKCQGAWVTIEAVEYPIVTVPSHAARPIVAKSDGPKDQAGRPVGVKQGEIYIRAPGPASAPIRTSEAWTTLLERCLSHRADLLANIMQRAIALPSKPSSRARDMVKAACDATAGDFITQVAETSIAPEDEIWFRSKSQNFAVFGYALVGNDGELLTIDNPTALNSRVSAALGQYLGTTIRRTAFRHVRTADRAPQVRASTLLGEETSDLEGMRLPAMPVISASEDYWRVYELGIVTIAESYREDHQAFRLGSQLAYLLVGECLARLHTILCHALFVGREMPSVSQIVLRADWRGLISRELCWDHDTTVTGKRLVDGRFIRTSTVPWSDLRNSYLSTLRRMALPFFAMFDLPGRPDAETWCSESQVQLQLADLGIDLGALGS